MEQTQPYAFAFSAAEVRRLIVQAVYWGDITEDFLRRAGLSAGMRVLDVGSGVGDVAMAAARLVGPRGSVLGIDRSADSLAVARSRADAAGLANLRFQEAEIADFAPDQRFDAVIGRLVLLHFPDPLPVLRRLGAMVAPGGVVAFQEPDLTAIGAEPVTDLGRQLLDWGLGAFGATGLDLRIGARLPRIFVAAGLPVPHAVAVQRLTSGADSPEYEYLSLVLRSMLPLVERFGLATAEQVDIESFAERLRQDSLRHDVIWSSIRMVGAWSRLPAA